MYLALYRKYRPKSFEDVLSQPHITTTLKNEVVQGKTAHAYLFTGPRGTGKTTCSKILAMAVNCEHPVDGNPCMECESCRAIESGSTMDVVEIDAASNNGVDSIRSLREEAIYTPGQLRYRVYIIDETHMLSTGAFNALLKIMEEPPEHVKFILATTEAHKVPATILSRCQRFDFRRIRPEDIKARLLHIASLEDFSLEDSAAELIARLADGGMRDALSILDQCAAFSQQVDLDTVTLAAGVVGREYVDALTRHILQKDASAALREIDRLYSLSKDMQGLLEELIYHFRDMMLCKTVREISGLLSALPEETDRLKQAAANFSLGEILYIIDRLQLCLDKMSRSYDKRLTLELCFVKLCTPSMNDDLDGILARISRLEAGIPQDGLSTPALEQPVTQNTIPAPPVVPPPPEEIAPPAKEESPAEKSPVPVENPTPPPAPARKAPPARDETSGAEGIHPLAEWTEILTELAKTDMPLCGVLRNSRAFVGGGVLYIDAPLSFAANMLKQEGNAGKVIAAAEQKCGVRYKLRIKSAPAAQRENPLDSLLALARENGIEVREESGRESPAEE